MKNAKKKDTTRATRKPGLRAARGRKANVTPTKKQKPATIHVLPVPDAKVVKGSVVPATFKAKAGKSGVMNGDDLGAAITNAFLAAGSNDLTAQESARIACDELLNDNGLDVSRWPGKNPGMLRMNVTNVLRGIRRNGESVLVRGKSFKPVTA